MIYSSILGNTELGMRPIEERMLYIGTLILADDDGRLRADPRFLKGQIFSYDEKITSTEVEGWLQDLASFGQISLYDHDGVRVLLHPKWLNYQRIRGDMYVPSKLPAPPLQPCNESVTNPYHKLSKDNISKDKVIGTPTPQDQNQDFFSNGTYYNELLELFSKDKDRKYIENEFKKFVIYWTEPNKSGTKVRWEQQSTFDAKRRLFTWLNRSAERSSPVKKLHYVS